MDQTIKLRLALDDDEDFLCEVYGSTRRDEVAAFGWDDAGQDAFLRMQFTMQHRAFKMQYPQAEHCIILLDETPAGRIIVDRGADRIDLTDIAVLPEFRKHGIATYLIRKLQDEAAAAGKPVVLQVDKNNLPARSLYEKLGFAVAGESQFSYEMEWKSREFQL